MLDLVLNNDHIEYRALCVKGESKETQKGRHFSDGDQVLLDKDALHFLFYLLTVSLICEKYLNQKGGDSISGKVIRVYLEIINEGGHHGRKHLQDY